ncbi:MAG: GDP-L-fucose synthase [Lentimicrobiaceae bacterium]|jgi:GDP-L-fucose synthase|nr:GDP-L-fucose synthase [Lentimicrobiaceae bacterium]
MNKFRIFLTGGDGMVGSNIREAMPDSEFEIICPDINALDLLNYQAVDSFIKKNSFGMLIHAAGIVGGIHANIKNPVKFLVENTDMARNVILSARNNGIKNLINLGSSCMYPREGKNPLKENSILTGELEPTNEGYALAKIYALRLCEYINRENQEFNYKTLIPCNLYGKYDKFDPQHSHLIPSIIYKLHSAKENNTDAIDIWGDGTARREFMYAGDLANFIWFAIANFNKLPNVMNVGLGCDYSINEYYETAAKIIDYHGKFIHDLSKPVGMKQKLVDTSQQKNLGWSPKFSLAEGIKETYNFYKSAH